MDYRYVPGISDKFGISPTMTERESYFKAYVDYDLFYIYLADAMVTIPAMAKFIEEQYELNKFVYYSKAINSPQYNATLMSDGRIKREALTKRAFGILLAAMDDRKLQSKICDLFISVYPSMRKLKKPFTNDLYVKLDQGFWELARNSKWVSEAQRGFWFFGAYVVDYYHGLNGNQNIGVVVAKMAAVSAVITGEAIDRKAFQKQVDKINPRSYIRTPASFREFKPLIQDSTDIHNAIYILRKFDMEDHYDSEYARNKRFAAIFDYLESDNRTTEHARFEIMLRNLMDAMTLAGKNTEVLIEAEPITPEEIEQIYKIVARNYQFEQGYSDRLIEIHASDYFQTLVIYQIMKAMNADRDFYYRNSSESRFLEMQSADRENAELRKQIAEQAAGIEALSQLVEGQRVQIDTLNAELLKDAKDAARDAAKPLLAEISMLHSQISALQSRLDAEAEKSSELNRLREFAFAMQQGGDIQIEDVALENLISNKKIYIFGGHINWRTKLKQKYPTLEVLDGHNTSFDAQMLIGADIVLLNTSNMSHDLYYKVIDVLRKHSVPFDYLGKYSNPNLLEKEISEILLRH